VEDERKLPMDDSSRILPDPGCDAIADALDVLRMCEEKKTVVRGTARI